MNYVNDWTYAGNKAGLVGAYILSYLLHSNISALTNRKSLTYTCTERDKQTH